MYNCPQSDQSLCSELLNQTFFKVKEPINSLKTASDPLYLSKNFMTCISLFDQRTQGNGFLLTTHLPQLTRSINGTIQYISRTMFMFLSEEENGYNNIDIIIMKTQLRFVVGGVDFSDHWAQVWRHTDHWSLKIQVTFNSTVSRKKVPREWQYLWNSAKIDIRPKLMNNFLIYSVQMGYNPVILSFVKGFYYKIFKRRLLLLI